MNNLQVLSHPTQRALDWWDAYASKERIQRLGIFRYNQPCPRPPTSK
jgi:hypothetical protein